MDGYAGRIAGTLNHFCPACDAFSRKEALPHHNREEPLSILRI